MPEYLSPGVYVEEVDAGPKPIAPVATSTAGAVGVTTRGPAQPTLVTSYGDFVRAYGGPLTIPDETTRLAWEPRGHWWQAAESVKAFFDEGGARMFFQRVQPASAAPSTRPFNAGVFALLESDVARDSRRITLSHLTTVAAGDALDLVSAEDGSVLGSVTVAAVDYRTRTVTLSADAGVTARSGRDLARITAVDAARNVLTVSAGSVGVWGDAIAVRLLPVVGARLRLGATPTSGPPVSTTTTAAAAAGATTITVAPVAGSLTSATPAGFGVRLNGGATVTVTNVAAAGAAVGLTVTPALASALPAGSTVQVLRGSLSGAVVTTPGSGRLYPGALVQLEGGTGAELLRVTAVSGSQVTLSSAPTGTYREGDELTVVEADVSVRYRPAGGDEVTERFSGLRLTRDGHPESLLRRVNTASRLVTLAPGADYDGTDLTRFPAVTGAPWAQLGGGDDGLAGLDIADFVGENLGPGQRSGIQALEDIDEVAICCVPGMYSPRRRVGTDHALRDAPGPVRDPGPAARPERAAGPGLPEPDRHQVCGVVLPVGPDPRPAARRRRAARAAGGVPGRDLRTHRHRPAGSSRRPRMR